MKLTAGKRFRLNTDVLAIEPFEHKNRARALSMAAGSIVEIIQYPCSISYRMAVVLLNGKVVAMFGHGVRHCAEEIKADAAKT
jgi:hypothetical protein